MSLVNWSKIPRNSLDSKNARALDSTCAKLIREYEKDFEYLGQGKDRHTFDLKTGYVLKLPAWYRGINANIAEAEWVHESIPLAECYLVPTTHPRIPALLMEKLDIIHSVENGFENYYYKNKLPAWTNEMDDTVQIGLNRRGEIVAYDCGG